MRKQIGIVAAVAGVLCASAAYAGYQYAGGTPSITSTSAIAILGSTRASADNTAYAGCTVRGTSTGSSIGWCDFVDAGGTSKTCSFSDPAMIQAVTAMTPYSAVRAFFTASGTCTSLYIDNYSFYLPLTP
jgi:hypothetical protein